MIPEEIRQTIYFMAIAASYNRITGASVTHQEVAEWGFLESYQIESAIRFTGDI
jgi:hypothetical protein